MSVNHRPMTLEQDAQRQTVSGFYALAVELNIQGLPTPKDLAQLAPYVSNELLESFEQARLKQELDLARHGGTEPPLVQGSPLVSLFEGASEVVNIEPGDDPRQWFVTLQYGVGPQAAQWTDVALVAPQSGRWVVSDIRFGGQWDFARQGKLSEMLGLAGQPVK